MDPINPWLDAADVRRLAERLMAPAREPQEKLPDVGFDEKFIGFATSPEAPRESPVESVAAPSPAPVSTPAAVTTAPVPPPPLPKEIPAAPGTGARGALLDRIHRFHAWMTRQFGASGIFILDGDGVVIFDEAGHEKLHFLARNLAQASRPPGSGANNVHVKIGAATTLEVIPVDTPCGCLVLGALVPETLDPAAIGRVREALVMVATPPAA